MGGASTHHTGLKRQHPGEESNTYSCVGSSLKMEERLLTAAAAAGRAFSRCHTVAKIVIVISVSSVKMLWVNKYPNFLEESRGV